MIKLEQTYSEILAKYISKLSYEDLSEEVVDKAKHILLDTLGVSIFGSVSTEATMVRQAISTYSNGGDVLVWGTDSLTTVPLSALANGTAAHAREMDDVGKNSGHPGAVIIPAALAVANSLGSSGKEVLTAIVAGYEVAERVAESVGGYRAHTTRGWHTTGTCCTFGAAAAAAKLMGLDQQSIASALGIAGSYTGGIWAFIEDGAMTKRFHPGKAAENGVVAAYMAQQGFTGPQSIFEAKWGGFCNTYSFDNVDDTNPEALIENLGSRLRITETGFKPYACCRGIHDSLDAFFQIIHEHHLTKDNIDFIEVITSEHAAKQLGKQTVGNFLDAQLSLPYSLSVALISGKAGPHQYTENWIRDSTVRDWCSKVQVHGHMDYSYVKRSPATVRVILANGKYYEGSQDYVKGSVNNPMTLTELKNKFLDLVDGVLPQEQIHSLLLQLLTIEDIESVIPVIQLLQIKQKN